MKVKQYSNIIYSLLLITIILFTNSCKIEEEEFFGRIIYDEDNESPLVSYIYIPHDANNVSYNKHLKKTVNYTKIPYGLIDFQKFNDSAKIPTSTKVLVVTNTKILSDKAFTSIINFVNSGGALFLPTINNDYKYRFLAGIKPTTNPHDLNYADGYRFLKNIIPDFKNKTYIGYVQHKGFLSSDYNSNTDVWATAKSNPDYPTILNHKLGLGNVTLFNSNQPAAKQDRGLYFSAILANLEGVPYPIINAGTIFLDDFPAPTYHIKKEPILSELNITLSDFYNKVWWPDMLKLAKEENLKYTIMTCFDYGINNKPPFLFNEWNNSKIKFKNEQQVSGDYIINDILKTDHELAFHGYNHISLLETDWPNQDYMQASLKAVTKKWKVNNYGRLPVTYVPPSNHIDEMGFKALKEEMPNIKYNCSLYLGHFNKGGEREYDYEPYNNAIFNFPRITSGYILNNERQFNQQSLFLYTGIWSHFIHPDDVYQIEDESNQSSKGNFEYRNKDNLGWVNSKDGSEGMLPRFKTYLKKVKRLFPMIRFIKTENAADQAMKWRYNNYNHQQKKETYVVEGNSKQLKKLTSNYWFTYITYQNKQKFEKHLNKLGLKFSHTNYLDGLLYTILTQTPKIEIPKINKKQPKKLENFPFETLYNYKTISDKTEQENTIDFYANNGRINKAISLLRDRIYIEKSNDLKDWKKLYKYLGWKNRELEIWKILNEKYLETKSPKWIGLSMEFVKNSDYPDLETRKLWMERQLKLYPKNVVLQTQYNYYFLEEDIDLYDLSTEELFKKLIANEIEDKASAIAILLDHKPKGYDLYIDTLKPCEDRDVMLIAENLTWYYANKKNYKKAISWSNCSINILPEDINHWRLSMGDYEFLKKNDYQAYLEYLFENEPEKALKEVQNMAPCSKNLSNDLITNIIYTYASKEDYRNALKWSDCLIDFDIKEQLYWLAELKDYKTLHEKYKAYSVQHPNTNDVGIYVAKIYADIGNIKEAWIIASKMPQSKSNKQLQIQLNQDVQYIKAEEQKFLLENHRNYFYPEIAKKLERQIVLTQNPFIKTDTNIITDSENVVTYTNSISYGYFSKKKHRHTFGVGQGKRFAILGFPENTINTERNLYGVLYSFQQRKKGYKPYFSIKARFDISEFKNLFYNLESSLFFERKKTYSFITLSHFPAITSPAYGLKIYQTQFLGQHEYKIGKRIESTINVTSNYFSDNAIDAAVLTTLNYKIKLNKNNNLYPNIEALGSVGSKDIPFGYPYWILKNRLYAGGGLMYKYANIKKDITFSVTASMFYDSFSDDFKRLESDLKLPLIGYFYLNANAFFSSIENLFSNEFNVGLTYHFK